MKNLYKFTQPSVVGFIGFILAAYLIHFLFFNVLFLFSSFSYLLAAVLFGFILMTGCMLGTFLLVIMFNVMNKSIVWLSSRLSNIKIYFTQPDFKKYKLPISLN